jgi:hypothetical protein
MGYEGEKEASKRQCVWRERGGKENNGESEQGQKKEGTNWAKPV